MKVWITSYALTKGVFEIEAEICEDTIYQGSMIKEVSEGLPIYYHKPHWWHSKELALVRAEQMRNAKIKSMEKQIEKLKKLTF